MSLAMGSAGSPAKRARRVWNIDQWGSGYYDVDDTGHALVRPLGSEIEGPALPLDDLVAELKAAGLRLPVLVRFIDILHDRVEQLCAAFDTAMAEEEFHGGYTAVYPIKVNQQRRVVEEILATPERGRDRVGLEAGSKPELLAVLALSGDGPSLIVCNGYKDREYVRLALMGEKLGFRVYIVVEKLSELDMILQESAALGVTPRIGLRVRLMSISKGNWQNSGGEKAKFGLSAAQIMEAVEVCRSAGKLDCVRMLHFHLGSQVANIQDIKAGMREAARYYQELRELGAAVDTMDVGGGLGVDYEGTRSRSYCSMNYSMADYAWHIVQTIKELCDRSGQPHPAIISESGRALTAHHAVLLANVIDRETLAFSNAPAPPIDALAEVHLLWQLNETLRGPSPNLLESYQDRKS